MQYELPKTKSLHDLDNAEEIRFPKVFNGDLDKLYIAPNEAFLTKIETVSNGLRIYVDQENEKGLCRFDGFIRIGSKNTNPGILQEIQEVLKNHMGESIDDISHAKLFS